jgi:hypothetical protein
MMLSRNLKIMTLAATTLALMAGPAMWSGNGVFGSTSAYAAGNGNGNGGGNGHGNGNASANAGNGHAGNGNSSPNSGGNHGAIASSLGALNAAHASAEAFANASPNSEIGRIKAYYLANQTALASQDTFNTDLTTAGVTDTQFQAVLDAYNALQADPTNVTLQDAYNQALTDNSLDDPTFQGLLTDYSTVQTDQQAADTLLEAAANKTPVSQDTKDALDALLVGKITP